MSSQKGFPPPPVPRPRPVQDILAGAPEPMEAPLRINMTTADELMRDPQAALRKYAAGMLMDPTVSERVHANILAMLWPYTFEKLPVAGEGKKGKKERERDTAHNIASQVDRPGSLAALTKH